MASQQEGRCLKALAPTRASGIPCHPAVVLSWTTEGACLPAFGRLCLVALVSRRRLRFQDADRYKRCHSQKNAAWADQAVSQAVYLALRPRVLAQHLPQRVGGNQA